VKRLDPKSLVCKDQGMLLYLSPQDARKLVFFLQILSQCLRNKSRSLESLHAIRKDLSDLLYCLSPLSKTGKILFELLDRTQTADSLDSKNIHRLVRELQDIYQITYLESKTAGFSATKIGA
jgi:hypothetical protein